MDVAATPLAGVFILKPKRFHDPRGYFSETYNRRRLEASGIDVVFVQDNISLSKPAFTLRGMHFQTQPFAQVKLVSVLVGKARDIVVDLRRSSPTFGQHCFVELSAKEGNQVYIPVGCAHGFLSLEPDTMLSYKVSNYYSPEHDAGIRFDDPMLRVDWGIDLESAVVSEKDQKLPLFDRHADYFP